MSYTAFISYNTSPEEQAFVYRLQTLASSSDIVVLLPQRGHATITSETRLRIDQADCVIAFLTRRLSAAVRDELAYAVGRGKLVIPIREKGVPAPTARGGPNWIEYDPARETPGEFEVRVLSLLKTKSKGKADRDAVVLVGMGLGLLWLLSKK